VDAIGGGKIFATHYLDHPYRGDTQVLGGWSYVWAGLFGPFYLLAKGFARAALLMAVYMTLIVAVSFGLITGVAVFASSKASTILGIAAIVTVALAINARVAIRLTLIAYLKAGYREGYY
jgi:hypothetical protein